MASDIRGRKELALAGNVLEAIKGFLSCKSAALCGNWIRRKPIAEIAENKGLNVVGGVIDWFLQ